MIVLAVVGAVGLLVGMSLPWFSAGLEQAPEGLAPLAERVGLDTSLTGWESWAALDVLVAAGALVALIAIVAPWGPLAHRGPIAITGSAIALVLVAGRAIDPPGDPGTTNREPGLFLALAGAAVLVYAAWRLLRRSRRERPSPDGQGLG